MPVSKLFPTQIFKDQLNAGALPLQLEREIADLAELDEAGERWSRENYPNGFTSYGSANQLQKNSPTFARLEKWIDSRVASYARFLDLDLTGGRLVMTNCWANVMHANTHHGMHLHPLAVISGTFYVKVPRGAPAIKFEDPRLSSLMHSPPRKEKCRRENQLHVKVPAKSGTLVLFESWLRHEVPLHTGRDPRISVSFNYDWV